MEKMVQLWVYLSATPLFGLTLTLVVYLCTSAGFQRLHQVPWANPVLWSILLLAGLLQVTQLPYEAYFSGAQFIHFLLGPAVVALAWPVYQRRADLRRNGMVIAIASVLGALVAVISVVVLARLLDLPESLTLSLAPKSVTAPVAMGIAEKVGGLPALAAVFAVLTGLVGSLVGRYVFDAMGIPKDDVGWAARGFALGSMSHGIGAARALQVNTTAGAYAALALGVQVLLCSLFLPPLLVRLL
jgi:predicted murein hydrolase (TIGR00659 family)